MKEAVAIVFGGKSCEHDISVLTGVLCYHAYPSESKIAVYINESNEMLCGEPLEDIRYYKGELSKKPTPCLLCGKILYAKRGNRLKPIARLSAAINCCHGGMGEGGEMYGCFAMNGVPLTGCDCYASAVCMSKTHTAEILKAHGFAVAEGESVRSEGEALEAAGRLGFPLIVKPDTQGSSIGISVAQSEEELKMAFLHAQSYSDCVRVERFISGATEFDCAALVTDGGVLISGVRAPLHRAPAYTFEEKYLQQTENGEVPPHVLCAVKEQTARLASVMHLSGAVRVDYLYNGETLYVGEVNTVPGSMAYYLFEDVGIKLPDILVTMVREAQKREQKSAALQTRFLSGVLKGCLPCCKGGKKMV